MEIKLNVRHALAELEITEGSAKITEDIASYSRKDGGYFIPESLIETFLTIGFEMSRYNKRSDVDTMKKLFDAFLNDSERKEFIELITNPEGYAKE